jgi:hypothetical protein
VALKVGWTRFYSTGVAFPWLFLSFNNIYLKIIDDLAFIMTRCMVKPRSDMFCTGISSGFYNKRFFMKSHSKIFNHVGFAVIALSLAACGSNNSSTAPTIASPGTVSTTCGGVQGGYVYTQEGELPQGSCPVGEGQVSENANGTPNCLPAIENGNVGTCNGINGQGIAPVNGICSTPGMILENGLCYYEGQYPGGVYGGQYPGVGYPGVGGGGTFGYPYNQNGGITSGIYYYNYNMNNGAGRCLPGGTFNGVGCVY